MTVRAEETERSIYFSSVLADKREGDGEKERKKLFQGIMEQNPMLH